MEFEHMPLPRQMEVVFRTISDELRHLSSGTVFVQIRNDVIGKFGVKHFPIELKGSQVIHEESGFSNIHLEAFRVLAVGALEHKHRWTHGDIYFEFSLRKGVLHASVTMESNYNMASLYNRHTK